MRLFPKKYLRLYPAFFLLFAGLWLGTMPLRAQQTEQPLKRLKGFVLQSKNKQPLMGANIINLTRLRGATTGKGGFFTIRALPGDTILVSYLGFKTFKWVPDSLSFGQVHHIYLQEQPIVLKEVVIREHALTGVLPVDLALMPKQDLPRIQLHLETMFGDTIPNALTRINDKLRTYMDPVGLLYNFFSVHGKDIRKLRHLKERDEITQILARRFDRKILSELLDLPEDRVYQVLEWCDYDKKFLREASDLQLLEALRECYEKHRPFMETSGGGKK